MNALSVRCLLAAGLLCGSSLTALAGGSGLNVLVVINQSSSNSCELGNYYCERRQVPPDNVLRLAWSGGNVSWSSDEFQTNLLGPLLALLEARQLTNQIDYVVLSMDIPFRTMYGTVPNSTTAALFYGLKTDSGPEWDGITNSYAGSEQIFRDARPASAPGYSFLALMITSDSLAQAKRLVDQGVASDGTFPRQTVLLEKTSDPLRNLRHRAFDHAIFNAQLTGHYRVARTNADTILGQTNLLGLETGLASFGISAGAFVPGAMADSMTSFGGIIFGASGHTSLLAFINAGASGSYGTVAEPQPVTDKFPDPQVYFYQARGFSLAESYYQGVNVPQLGLIVGEPLAAPFQRPGSGTWLGVSSNAVLSGAPALSVQFAAAGETLPLQQVDLFVDGRYFRTLTNVAPQPGNQLQLTLNGHAMACTVPTNATLASVARDFAGLIGASGTTNLTKTTASVFGDRIELRCYDPSSPPPPSGLRLMPGAVSTNAPAAPWRPAVGLAGSAASLTIQPCLARNNFLSSPAAGFKRYRINAMVQVGSWLQMMVTKTNQAPVALAVTNQSVTANAYALVQQLVSLINTAPGLQGPDGVTAEDFAAYWGTGGTFNLRARSPGYRAARIAVALTGSSEFAITPSAPAVLDDNLPDLQPRNHLYLRAGVTNLAVGFTLDTTSLADGFHELAAVAYEGSHVRTQTRATLPVQVRNSGLSATLTRVELPDTAPAAGIYRIEVAANTNDVSAIRLFSTGGLLAAATNQSSATFAVNGAGLGPGRHPFYALVETASGLKYRTATHWVRLTSGP